MIVCLIQPLCINNEAGERYRESSVIWKKYVLSSKGLSKEIKLGRRIVGIDVFVIDAKIFLVSLALGRVQHLADEWNFWIYVRNTIS